MLYIVAEPRVQLVVENRRTTLPFHATKGRSRVGPALLSSLRSV